MEEEECLYSKYGYCKYKEQCTKRHYTEKCEELGDCKGVRVCPRRHPNNIIFLNPVYGRQRISRPMRIVGPIQLLRG